MSAQATSTSFNAISWNYPGVVGLHGNGALIVVSGNTAAVLDPETGEIINQVDLPQDDPAKGSYNGFVTTSDRILFTKALFRSCDTVGSPTLLECLDREVGLPPVRSPPQQPKRTPLSVPATGAWSDVVASPRPPSHPRPSSLTVPEPQGASRPQRGSAPHPRPPAPRPQPTTEHFPVRTLGVQRSSLRCDTNRRVDSGPRRYPPPATIPGPLGCGVDRTSGTCSVVRRGSSSSAARR